MSGKTVLVTGASRGIGRAIALTLAHKGYNLILTCKEKKELLNSVYKEVKSFGISCITYVGDLSDYNQVCDLFRLINKENISIDILVNNMGISHIGLLQDMTIAQWQNIINTNLTAVFAVTKHTIPYMLASSRGKIINISSVWGNTGASCEVAYSASKGGLNAFTKALAKELAPSNIQVNAVACGVINTEMNDFLTKEEITELIQEIPMGKLARPDDVGIFVWQLCNAPDYLTGQIIEFDGGWK